MEPIRIRFVEYGKAFLEHEEGHIVTDFLTLKYSDAQTREREKSFRDLLSYSDKSSFLRKHGKVSFGLFRNRASNEYIFTHIQRRRELELAPSLKGRPNREYYQIRYTVLSVEEIREIYLDQKSFIVCLAELGTKGLRLNETGEKHRLCDYLFKETGKEGIQAKEHFINPNYVDLNNDLLSYAILIANLLIEKYEISQKVLPYLKVGFHKDFTLDEKIILIQQIQLIVYPRVGVITFSFDDVFQQEVNILFCDQDSSRFNSSDITIPKPLSANGNTNTCASRILDNLNKFYQNENIAIFQNSDLSFEEAEFLVIYRNGKRELDVTLLNQAFDKMKPDDQNKYIASFAESSPFDIHKQILSKSDVSQIFKQKLMSHYLETKKDPFVFYDLYFVLSDDEKFDKSSCSLILKSFEYLKFQELSRIPPEGYKKIIDVILCPNFQIELNKNKRYWADQNLFNPVEAASLLDLEYTKEKVSKILFQANNFLLQEQLKLFAMTQNDIGYFSWAVNLLRSSFDRQSIASYLLDKFSLIDLDSKQNINHLEALIEIFSEEKGFLSRIPKNEIGYKLEEKLLGLVGKSLEITKKRFEMILEFPFEQFIGEYIEMRKKVADNLLNDDAGCVKYLFCDPINRPSIKFLEECKFKIDHRIMIIRALISSSEFIKAEDIVYVLENYSDERYYELAREILRKEELVVYVRSLNADIVKPIIQNAITRRSAGEEILKRLVDINKESDFWLSLMKGISNDSLIDFRKIMNNYSGTSIAIKDMLISSGNSEELLKINDLLLISPELSSSSKEKLSLLINVLNKGDLLTITGFDEINIEYILRQLKIISQNKNVYADSAREILDSYNVSKQEDQNTKKNIQENSTTQLSISIDSNHAGLDSKKNFPSDEANQNPQETLKQLRDKFNDEYNSPNKVSSGNVEEDFFTGIFKKLMKVIDDLPLSDWVVVLGFGVIFIGILFIVIFIFFLHPEYIKQLQGIIPQ